MNLTRCGQGRTQDVGSIPISSTPHPAFCQKLAGRVFDATGSVWAEFLSERRF